MTEPAPDARYRPPKRKPSAVAVLYNVDYEDSSPDGDPGYAARADVGQVAATHRAASSTTERTSSSSSRSTAT